MIIKFDDYILENNHVMNLKMTSKLFENGNPFKLGATLCIAIDMDISKNGFINTLLTQGGQEILTQYNDVLGYGIPKEPHKVTFYDGNTKFLTAYIDSIEEKNDNYLTYHLYDSMLKLNEIYDYSQLDNYTVQEILNKICLDLLKTQAPTISYLGDMKLAYSDNVSAREIVSYIAEVNGSYARINENDELEFISFNRKPIKHIDCGTCADITLGDMHLIDRVGIESGTASIYYPNDKTDNDTLYLNADNPLISDSSGYSRDTIIKSVYDSINGFTFYNFKTSKCAVDKTIQAGDLITLDLTKDFLLTQSGQEIESRLKGGLQVTTSYIYTIANFEWTYNTVWLGGFDLNVTTSKQEETKVISNAEKKINKVKIEVNHEIGKISQTIESINGDISSLSQTSSDIQANFVKKSDEDYTNLTTNIKFDINGVNIASNNVKTNLQLSSGGVYIRDNNNQSITSMEKNQFSTGEWVLSQTSNSINFYRRHNNG